MKYIGLSLFSSAGIGEYYIHEFINIKVANELKTDRASIYKHFYPDVNMIEGDITNEIIYNDIIHKCLTYKVDFIIATPPCQGFSKAGKQNINDKRNILFLYIIDIIKKINPKYIIIENVPEFIKSKIYYENKLINIIDIFKTSLPNYNIQYNILDSKYFGVPQSRKRSIILLSNKSFNLLKIPNQNILNTNNIITVRDAIGNLPSLKNGETRFDINKWFYCKNHNKNHILWMENTPTGKTAFDNSIYYPQKDGRKIKGFKTTYKRIEWDKPSPTITMTNGSISSQNNVHPGRLLENGLYSDARVLSVYELIILTGLDDNWILPENISESIARHILGECVPPKLINGILKYNFTL
jgi:DNA (cytosine-5)-methyltransferase 1